jgi:hypothetical protein
VEPLEDIFVLRRDRARLFRVRDVLAEDRRVRVEALVVQPPENGDALVQRLARNEARSPEPHAVLAHERPHARALRRREDELARYGYGAPNSFSAEGALQPPSASWVFSMIARSTRAVTAVPFSVWTGSSPLSVR